MAMQKEPCLQAHQKWRLAMSTNLLQNKEYKTWLKDLKQTILHTQIKAAVKVNTTLL